MFFILSDAKSFETLPKLDGVAFISESCFEFIDFNMINIPARSAPQILSLKDEYTSNYISNFLIIVYVILQIILT